MLTPEHIRHLGIGINSLSHHEKYLRDYDFSKTIARQFKAIGHAAISRLMGIDDPLFEMQLEAAEEFGASYLFEEPKSHISGVSAVTSMVRDDRIISKNAIFPSDLLSPDNRLKSHYIIGVFILGDKDKDRITRVDDVYVAGWINARDIKRSRELTTPGTFQSPTRLSMVNCAKLKPVDILESIISP